MLIMPNQESEWVQQVVRNIPSPAVSIQWDNSDFEAKKGEENFQTSRTDWKFILPIWWKGLVITSKTQNKSTSRRLFIGPKLNFGWTSPKTIWRKQNTETEIGTEISTETGALSTNTSFVPLSSRAVCVLSLRSEEASHLSEVP